VVMKRPILKALVAAVPCEDGLIVRTPQTQTLLRGAAASQWYHRLAMKFDGTHNVDDFLAVLPPDRHPTFHSLIAALEKAGALRDAAMDDPVPVSERLAQSSSDNALVAHLEQHTESPRRALARFRATPILVTGAYSAQVVEAVHRLGTASLNIGHDVGMASHPRFVLCLAETYEEACTQAQLAALNVQATYLCAGRCGDELWIGPWPTADPGEACLACICAALHLQGGGMARSTALPLSAVEIALLSAALGFGVLAIITNTLRSVTRPGEWMTCLDRATMVSTPQILTESACNCSIEKTNRHFTASAPEQRHS
jgi:hypothetical protein